MKTTFKQNLKDNVSNIAKWVILITGFIIGLPLALQTTFQLTLILDKWVYLTCGIAFLFATFLSVHLIGKNNDGSVKTPEQINAQLNPPKA